MEEEKTPLRQGFFGEHTRLENHNNPSKGASFQSSSKCKSKIGLFLSFLALSASLEILLTSSLDKNALPGGDSVVVVNEFLTNTLNSNYKHFTYGTVVGVAGFALSLIALVCFLKILSKKLDKQAYRPHGIRFFESGIDVVKAQGGFKTHEYFELCGINPKTQTLAIIVQTNSDKMYVGIPHDQYEKNNWCGYILQEEIDKLINKGLLPEKCYYDHFIIVPVEKCFNLNKDPSSTPIVS